MDAKRYELNVQLAQMLIGGVIMDVTNVEQAKLAEEAGAVAVMALERVPSDVFQKYFEPAEREGWFRVVEKIRNVVTTQHHNLLSLQPVRDDFSLIVCKNVLLHFQYPERIEVYKMFHQALEPGGLLVNEHTQKLPPEVGHLFTQVVSDGQLYSKVAVNP